MNCKDCGSELDTGFNCPKCGSEDVTEFSNSPMVIHCADCGYTKEPELTTAEMLLWLAKNCKKQIRISPWRLGLEIGGIDFSEYARDWDNIIKVAYLKAKQEEQK